MGKMFNLGLYLCAHELLNTLKICKQAHARVVCAANQAAILPFDELFYTNL